ncbi:MAG: guanylate kinase [Candidatus Saccharibacteria bacterium]|nr:guanylate kinase [Candidatus Saccharibacteria bacterium]
MDDSLEQRIKQYQESAAVIDELRPVETVMLIGITGAGKDTVIGDILKESDEFIRVVTSTTRAPRENNGIMEQDGREYYFLTVEQAIQKMEQKEYIEVAPVHGRVNGSLISEYRRISERAKTALTDINYEGAEKFLTFGMENLSVYFVMPPNFEVWFARLMKRQGGVMGDHDEILRRFRSAQKELDYARNQPDFIPITNNVSHDTAAKIIEYSKSKTGPSVGEREQANSAMRDLSRAISNYIGQLEDIR